MMFRKAFLRSYSNQRMKLVKNDSSPFKWLRRECGEYLVVIKNRLAGQGLGQGEGVHVFHFGKSERTPGFANVGRISQLGGTCW
jgi:hypothetical protein